MKKTIALLLAILMCAAMLSGCSNEEPPKEDTPKASDSEKTESVTPTVPGKMYDTGAFSALVPEGWAAFPITDVFSEDDAADPTCFNIIKGGQSDLDLFSKPYVRLDYYGPDTQMMKPSSEYYENVEELDPMQLGSHSWSGFIGEDGYGKSAILWAEEGNIEYQAIVWLEIENEKISIKDTDVQAILASVVPSDGTAASGTENGQDDTAASVLSAEALDWWEGDWYGWWAITNGTGTYKEPSDLQLVWDTFAEIEINDNNTGRVRIWDTGTSKDALMIIGYDVSLEAGASELGRLVSKRVDFFPYSQWNNGMEAVTMSERNTGWVIDPADSTVSHFDDMLEITGHYESPDNADDSFDYHIYLRPWGTLWEDVRNGNTEGCLYKDMMPLYHDNWYISLLNLGYEHPVATFQEGIDTINDYLAAQANGGSSSGSALDPAAKAGADGKVDMATLKNALAWCKENASYSTTYDEIAAQFGVHGKQEKSLFEQNTIYRWWATEDAYVKITFTLGDGGTELWNVTQYNGVN